MSTFAQYDAQMLIEQKYSKSNINRKVTSDLTSNDEIHEQVKLAVVVISNWLNKATHGYKSKDARLAFFNEYLDVDDIREIVWQIVVVVSQQTNYAEFTSVVGQLFNILPGDNKVVKLKTMSEMMALCCTEADLFTIHSAANSPHGHLSITPTYRVSEETANYIYQTRYLPPMVCEPNELVHNRSSAYLTRCESLILGAGNHHEDDICLDALNLFNSIPLSLNEQMLSSYSEEPEHLLDTIEKQQQFTKFARESVIVAANIIGHGNKCYLSHKPDKRGRIYCQGYHLSYQGNDFRKSIVDFHDQEVVEGF